ncbi:hypothetical protein BDP55DRAFT_440333 [Colletotrichum godetiae]|uniref:Uncharacterized protein n=1 Tax=Colletotrichum godetiae TaxID=1209918 RepID=A0AAJ0A7L9_9PEZI|nr:uncharacterized protein BDP55DRAFT_440333 [Colletotrichum godetiae]KAK1657368.1 hypothetical protein BDP55DRAFT_440333 [Colletotrichum godetiae]
MAPTAGMICFLLPPLECSTQGPHRPTTYPSFVSWMRTWIRFGTKQTTGMIGIFFPMEWTVICQCAFQTFRQVCSGRGALSNFHEGLPFESVVPFNEMFGTSKQCRVTKTPAIGRFCVSSTCTVICIAGEL